MSRAIRVTEMTSDESVVELGAALSPKSHEIARHQERRDHPVAVLERDADAARAARRVVLSDRHGDDAVGVDVAVERHREDAEDTERPLLDVDRRALGGELGAGTGPPTADQLPAELGSPEMTSKSMVAFTLPNRNLSTDPKKVVIAVPTLSTIWAALVQMLESLSA